MKSMLKRNHLPWVAGLSGLVACALRGSVYAFFIDARNLLPVRHPAVSALWLLTALTGLAALAAVGFLPVPKSKRVSFPASLPAALGHIFLAAGILLTVLLNGAVIPGAVGSLWKLLGVVSAPLLLLAAFHRAVGRRPFFLGYVAVSVFFAFHLVCHYRTWCSDPQLQNYFFAFTGALGLMMLAYYHGAACVGMGNHRMLLLSGLLSAYLCLASLPNCPYVYLYLGGAVWALTSLCPAEGMLSRKEKAGDDHAAP